MTARKQCTNRHPHVHHRWWSRKRSCYFECGGREAPKMCPVCGIAPARDTWGGLCGPSCAVSTGA